MSENNNDKITVKRTLTLKRSVLETSTVKQNFSHGRTKAVVVETKRRKITRTDEKAETPQPITKPHVAPQRSRPRFEDAKPNEPTAKSNLSSAEIEARLRALEEAHIQERIIREQAEEEARRAKEREESLRQTIQKTEIDETPQEEEEPTLQTQTPSLSPAQSQIEPINIPITPKNTTVIEKRKADETKEDDRNSRRTNLAKSEVRAPKVLKGADEKRRGKITLNSALDEEGSARGRSMAAMRRRQEKFKRAQNQEPKEKISREVILPETITIQELAQRMTERSVDVIKFLMKQGQMMKPGDVIDADVAELIAVEFGHTVKRVLESDVEEGIFNIADNPQKMQLRPPVVTIMGHVDHGKTSLLDAIRKANVVSGEAGGITQHIGAYQVEKNGQKITFIDTPGHAAFTAMRARGARVTDIAVLVVAADDSVMPQTIESINHAKAAGVPIIVAINKIDKPTANAQKVRTELLHHEVFVETMGGETLEVEVSAKTGQNLDKLLEAILLQAEILDLKADPQRTAEGVVIEAKLDRGRGSVATVLVQKGTLHPSDIIVAGNEWGRVRALIDDHGRHVKEAVPSTPIEILGMQGTPQAGDRFAVVTHEAKAREIAEYRQRLARDKAVARQTGSRGSLEQMMSKLQTTGVKEFPLIIKGDVQGSIEAIASALEKLGNEEVRARIVHSAAGGITESDISLAEASHSAVIGFNVRANKQARDCAKTQGIEIRYYNIIYDLVDDIKAAMSGLLSPEQRETFLGNAEILEVFNITKIGKVAGCLVTEGKIERGAGVRLIRDNIVIHEGKLKTLKRFKDEVNEVQSGQECGIAFENYEDIRTGDIIETFHIEHINRTL
ncbi:translation initiation factor IF-2 [Bartonella henselae]|uniref:Translation initiation factor IF-2 n=1 Tax=Bartonella henselae TaxID=38323 RepID=X5M5U9_BARHN|nr:translation initiation factor IF-2 [Bartonella henselae]ATP11852.1 translation initiation factor IF-2 [Bartonella henselae]ETS07578.1 translation initiation factor IF-2 [Bartonella henselae JK 42]ETS10221.1 translation initiation factor IF-2 [Bartonella henselae JK 50]ETS10728.1 translation initiation factor IF-2 [Bartonella henselae JK 51]ETS16381.1 translation initiation factor IF-2 [Bartonella henselae JK 41]